MTSADGWGSFWFVRQLYQGWAEPFDLVTMKLLIYHVSEHRDDNLVRPLWSRLFDESEDHSTFHNPLRLDAWTDIFPPLVMQR